MAADNSFVFPENKISMSSTLAYFCDLKKNAKLCDVTIRIGNRSISGHRVILGAAIPYFHDLFTSNKVESKENEITFKELDPEALECLINFAYTGQVEITTENVQSLLTASDYLLVTQVRDYCYDFLSKRLSPSNVIQFRTLADRSSCSSMIEKCDSYIRQHFEEFSRRKEFLSLSFPFINELIRRDDIRIKNEESVFEAVMYWVKADAERRSLLPELLTGIRMTLLTPRFLVNKASTDELIMESIPCRNLLDEAKHYHLLPKERPARCSFILSKRCYGELSGMYQLRYDAQNRRTVLKYNCENATWSALLYDKSSSMSCQVFALGDQIYVFRCNAFQRFNTITWEWSPPMKFPNNWPHIFQYVVPYNKRIYCFHSDSTQCRGCYFDPEENEWHYQEQNVLISEAQLVSSSEGIYILYSLFEDDGFCTRKSKIYNPETTEITEIPNMPTTRTQSGCAVLDGKIYVCGGRWHSGKSNFRGDVLSKHSEVYSPSDGWWRAVAEMNIARENFSLVPYNKKLYAIGGQSNSGYVDVDLIECYDPIKNKWTLAGNLNRESGECVKAVVVNV